MLIFSEILNNLPVASVQATRQIGMVVEALVDPRDLSIPALRVQTPQRHGRWLFTADIRSVNASGLIIDHDEQLMEPEGLVRLQEVVRLKFQLLGKRVETEEGRRLGSVGRWAFDTLGWKIIKLHINPTVGKSLGSSGLIIDRQQIVKITDNRIIVKSTAIKQEPRFSWRRLLFGAAKPALEPETAKLESAVDFL
jgi:uncharacterized protein YrrD